MMMDIFSSFDPFSFNTFSPTNSMFLAINTVLILILQASFWLRHSQSVSYLVPAESTIFTQLSRTFSVKIKGNTSVVSSIFMVIVLINLMGLLPYMFSTSSHLIFTLTLGFPVWMSLILSSFSFNAKKSVAHFLPDGAPDWLNPFLVVIETTSVMVRPMTLSFRLAANMSAGHIVLGLMGIYSSSSWFNSYLNTLLLTSVSIGYTLFEVAICLIQGYIFCLLLSLYSDDHSH